VDHVDLVQLHNLVEPDEWDIAFGPRGAVAALAAARDEGLCRFIGVTGHGLRIASMHVRSLRAFDFDSVLFPYNFVLLQERQYRAEVDELIAMCSERDVAMQTIKSIARGRWSGSREGKFSWYEPLEDPDAIARAVHFVLADQRLFVNTTSDATRLSTVLDAVASSVRTTAPGDEELHADVERFGITPLFDGGALERI
jgi:aryl-alcohol dehydrogenase-like predicted oxidoreductase